MTDAKPTSSRLIGLLYWAVWGWLALAVGFCAAAATWVGWSEVVLLTLLGLPIVITCGLWAAILFGRAVRMSGRQRFERLASRGGALLVVLSGVFAAWTVHGVLRVYWHDYLGNWRGLVRLDPPWSSRFTVVQVGAGLVAAAAVLAGGWLVAIACRYVGRRALAGETPIVVSRLRVGVILVLCVGILPVLMLGGYEQARRLGMAEFLFIYEDEAAGLVNEYIDEDVAFAREGLCTTMTMSPSDSPFHMKGFIGNYPWNVRSMPRVCLELIHPADTGLSLPPARRLLIAPVPAERRADMETAMKSPRGGLLYPGNPSAPAPSPDVDEEASPPDAPVVPPPAPPRVQQYPLHYESPLWNGWQDYGPSLNFPPPWRSLPPPQRGSGVVF